MGIVRLGTQRALGRSVAVKSIKPDEFDFYLRKVLGFAPTIDQAFGYGRGVHNLMRAIHSDPRKWAELAHDDASLKKELNKLIDRGLFYLRYTTGDPAENMRAKGVRIAADYVKHFADELRELTFEPEKEFETVVEYEDGTGGAMTAYNLAGNIPTRNFQDGYFENIEPIEIEVCPDCEFNTRCRRFWRWKAQQESVAN